MWNKIYYNILYLPDCLLLILYLSGNICSQSLKDYFRSQGHECNAYKPSYKRSYKFYVSVPVMNFDPLDVSICTDILEWVGAQICEIQ